MTAPNAGLLEPIWNQFTDDRQYPIENKLRRCLKILVELLTIENKP